MMVKKYSNYRIDRDTFTFAALKEFCKVVDAPDYAKVILRDRDTIILTWDEEAN